MPRQLLEESGRTVYIHYSFSEKDLPTGDETKWIKQFLGEEIGENTDEEETKWKEEYIDDPDLIMNDNSTKLLQQLMAADSNLMSRLAYYIIDQGYQMEQINFARDQEDFVIEYALTVILFKSEEILESDNDLTIELRLTFPKNN